MRAMTFSRRSIHRLEVEAVEALGGRELRRLDAPLDHPPFAIAPKARFKYWLRTPPGISISTRRARNWT